MIRNFSGFIAALSGVILFMNSCKENTILPPDLVPVVDNIHTFQADSFSLISNTIFQDSILTGGSLGSVSVSNNASFYHALGTITGNPEFGYTHASMHVELVPPSSNYTHKGYDPMFDSIVLSLPYINTFGDSIAGPDQYFLVYRSLKSFPKTSPQYENTLDSFEVNKPMGSYTMNFNQFRKDTNNKTMRIKLASWFADSLKAQMDLLAAGGATSSYEKFLDWWRGFYVTSISSQGNTLGYFNTYGARMYVYYRYYKDTAHTDVDTTIDVFAFDPSYCNRFNHIERRYTGSNAVNYLNSGAVSGDSLLHIQNLPGLATIIKFPYLPTSENVLINRAVLTLYSALPLNAMIDSSVYGIVPRFQVFRVDQGSDKILNEYTSLGAGFVDAKRREVTVYGQKYLQYNIYLSESIQNMISTQDTTFRLKIMGLSDVYPGAYGSILKGSTSKMDSLRPKLNVIYTKIN